MQNIILKIPSLHIAYMSSLPYKALAINHFAAAIHPSDKTMRCQMAVNLGN